MITSLHVRNFQSHKITDIDFSPGVNVILGPSDSGKTALIRALRWAFFNLPQGDAFRSDWGGDTRVAVGLEDGRLIRDKTNSQNLYMLNDEEFKAFGRNVPEPISEFLNLSRINLLSQYDPPFMIAWKPTERGEYLNKICNYEVIDRAIRNVNKMIRTEKSAIKSLEGELKRHKENEEALPDIEAMDEALSAIEEKETDLDGVLKDIADMEDQISILDRSAKRLAEFNTLLPAEGDIDDLIEKHRRMDDLALQIEDLECAIEDVEAEEKRLARLDKELEAAEEKLLKVFPDICPLCGGEVDETKRHKILS